MAPEHEVSTTRVSEWVIEFFIENTASPDIPFQIEELREFLEEGWRAIDLTDCDRYLDANARSTNERTAILEHEPHSW